MYSYTKTDLAKNTFQLDIKIPKEDVEKEYDKSFSKLQQELTVEGFRKGKAPKDIAKKHIKKDKVYQDLVNSLLSRIYSEIIQKEGLKPVINPKIDLTKAKENENWEIKITVAGKPKIDIGDYKKVIKSVKAEQKKNDIWTPGKDKEASKEKDDEKNKQRLLNEILSALLKSVKIEISDLILEEEISRRLTKLVDDIQKIGLTTESYLKSKNLTMESLKKQYEKEILDTYKLEFLLMEIADKENIQVDKQDLEKMLENIKDEKARKAAEQNSYFYATVIRKQKTLDSLLSL